jgi:hypothetical protein
MGAAKRRREAAAPANPELDAYLGEIMQEAGTGDRKVLAVEIIYAERSLDLLAAVFAGEGHARQMLGVVSDMLAQVRQCEARGEPMLCLLCDREFSTQPGRLPRALVILSAFRDDKRHCIVNGLCRACAGRDLTSELKQRVYARLLKGYGMNDARLVPTPGEPGHA